MTVLGDDHGNDLTDAADHAVDADERPVGGARVRTAPVLDRPDALGLAMAGLGPVLAGEHREHPRHGCGPRRIDVRHCSMGVGAADEGGVGDRLVEGHILDEAAAPPEEALVLPAQNRLTDVHGPLPTRAALPGGHRALAYLCVGNLISTRQYRNRLRRFAGCSVRDPLSGRTHTLDQAICISSSCESCRAEPYWSN